MIQLWSAIAVAVLTVIVGPIIRGEVSGRLLKRIAAHADLRSKLSDGSAAKRELDALLDAEVKALRTQSEYRLTRRVNGGNVAALIFIALVGGLIVYGLVAAGLALSGTGWAIILFVVAVLVGLFAILLAAAGMGTLYAPPKPRKSTPKKS